MSMLTEVFTLIVEGLKLPLTFFVDPSRRLYWVYLLGSLLLAGLFLIFSGKRGFQSVKEHKASMWLDVQFLFFNSVVRVFWASLGLASVFALTAETSRTLSLVFGDSPALDWSVPAIAISLTLVSFAFFDFLRFFQHLLMHKVSFLWEFHKVHHTATYLTPITLYRMHPVENIISFCRRTLGRGFLFGVFVYLFGARVNAYDIMGVNSLAFAFNVLGANLRHSPFPLGFGILENLFISPAQHQIHHTHSGSVKNFGVSLAIWDKLYGSLQKHSPEDQSYKFGMQGDKVSHSLGFQLLNPFVLGFQQTKRLGRHFIPTVLGSPKYISTQGEKRSDKTPNGPGVYKCGFPKLGSGSMDR